MIAINIAEWQVRQVIYMINQLMHCFVMSLVCGMSFWKYKQS